MAQKKPIYERKYIELYIVQQSVIRFELGLVQPNYTFLPITTWITVYIPY